MLLPEWVHKNTFSYRKIIGSKFQSYQQLLQTQMRKQKIKIHMRVSRNEQLGYAHCITLKCEIVS